MNKKVLSLVLASAMSLSTIAAVCAADEEVTPISDVAVTDVKVEPTYVKSEDLTVKEVKDGVITASKVNAVEDEKQENVVILKTNKAVFYKNDGTEINLEDLKEGDLVTAFTRADEPTALVLPETYTPAVIIVNEEGKDVNVTVSTFFKDADTDGYINAEKNLVIFLPEGFVENKKAGNDYIVFYSVTTKSIPAQTTPEKLVLLEEEYVEDETVEIPYTDVADDYRFIDSILKATEMGIMNGVSDTEFAPESNMTRAMFVTILYRYAGEPEVNKSIPFADVNMNEYYGSAVIWAQQNGIVNGVSETEFAPNLEVTREQMAAVLYRYANIGKEEAENEAKNTNILSYDDAENISEYAVEAMQWACGQNVLIERTEGLIYPGDNATRAEAANAIVVLSELSK